MIMAMPVILSPQAVLALSTVPTSNGQTIPPWIKNTAMWWSENHIRDDGFVQVIQYLIQNGAIQLPQTQTGSSSLQKIPVWIKNNADWWATGQISDDDFFKGIQYMIQNGIIKIQSKIQNQNTVSTCNQGYEYDANLKQCVPLQAVAKPPCREGYRYDAYLNQCLPIFEASTR